MIPTDELKQMRDTLTSQPNLPMGNRIALWVLDEVERLKKELAPWREFGQGRIDQINRMSKRREAAEQDRDAWKSRAERLAEHMKHIRNENPDCPISRLALADYRASLEGKE